MHKEALASFVRQLFLWSAFGVAMVFLVSTCVASEGDDSPRRGPSIGVPGFSLGGRDGKGTRSTTSSAAVNSSSSASSVSSSASSISQSGKKVNPKEPYRRIHFPAVGNETRLQDFIGFGIRELGLGLYDHFRNPGVLVDVRTGQILDSMPPTDTYAVPGVLTRTLHDAVEFGKTIGADVVRWNQSTGPLADLIKAGLEKNGVLSALDNSVVKDILDGIGGLTHISCHSMGTAVCGNALYDSRLEGKMEGVKVDVYAPIMPDRVYANNPAKAEVTTHVRVLDAVPYLRNPIPVGEVILAPIIPWQHPIKVYKKGGDTQ